MRRAFYVADALHLTAPRITIDIRRKRARVAQQCAAIEAKFFRGKPCLLTGGLVKVNGRHYA